MDKFYFYKNDNKNYQIITNNLFKVIHSLLGKKDICIEIKNIKKSPSNQQRRYLFGVVYPLIQKELINLGNEDYNDIEDVHEFMKFQTRHYKKKSINLNGQDVVTVEYKSIGKEGCLIETMEYIDKCIRWAAEMLSIEIPEPNACGYGDILGEVNNEN